MHLTVLAVPDCPNAPVLDDRLAAVLNGRTDVSVLHEMITDENEAARRGMHGSPTLLVDGVDPFACRGSRRACPAVCIAMTTARHRVRRQSASSGRRLS